MIDDDIIGIPPILANLPSCVLYLRPFGTPSGGTTFKDWSPAKKTLTAGGSVANTTSNTRFPPATLNFTTTSDRIYASTASDWTFLHNNAAGFICGFWCRQTSSTNGITLIDTTNGSSSNTGVYCGVYSDGSIHCFTTKSSSGIYPYNATSTTGLFPFDGTWHYICLDLTGASGTMYIYLDGTQIATSGLLVAASSSSPFGAVTIGNTVTSNNAGIGNVDEAVIFNAALGVIPSPAQLYAPAKTRRLIV